MLVVFVMWWDNNKASNSKENESGEEDEGKLVISHEF